MSGPSILYDTHPRDVPLATNRDGLDVSLARGKVTPEKMEIVGRVTLADRHLEAESCGKLRGGAARTIGHSKRKLTDDNAELQDLLWADDVDALIVPVERGAFLHHATPGAMGPDMAQWRLPSSSRAHQEISVYERWCRVPEHIEQGILEVNEHVVPRLKEELQKARTD